MNCSWPAVFCCLLAVFGLPRPGVAGDWPLFRGDSELRGVADTSLPDKPALSWKFKTGDAVKSAPVIVSNVVYIGSGDSNVYALNFSDGRKVWSFPTDGPVDAPPMALENTIYVGSLDGFLYALDAGKGTLRWKYKTDDKILGSANYWKQPYGPVQIIAGSYDYRLHSIDAVTGKSNWVYETGNYINGTPAIFGGRTVFGGCDGFLHVISLANGKQVAEIDAGAYVAASAALADGRAYFGNYGNEFLCVDFSTSTEGGTETPKPTASQEAPSQAGGQSNLVWRFKEKEFPFFSSAAVTKDQVVFGGRDKRLHCLNRATGEEIWSFATQGKVDSSPVVAGEKIVVGSHDGRVYVVSLKDGKELWSYEIGEPIESSPGVADSKFVIGSDDGYVYCFGTKTGEAGK